MKILPIPDEKQDSDLKEALIRKNSHSKHGNDNVCAVQLDYIEYGLDMILALVPQMKIEYGFTPPFHTKVT